MPGWSAESSACSAGDAAAVLAKLRQYSSPAHESPKHRWLVSKHDDSNSWTITEYSGLRTTTSCQPVTKADELNGVQYGMIELRFDARRTTDWPKLTSAGLQWKKWTAWMDPPKSTEKGAGLLVQFFESDELRDLQIDFRKYKGKIQLEWDYVESPHITLMSSVEVSRFLSTADAQAAVLRTAEAEQAKLAQVEAERLREQQLVAEKERQLQAEQSALRREEFAARVKKVPNPADYYPSGSLRREEQGTVGVHFCIDPAGRLKDTRV